MNEKQKQEKADDLEAKREAFRDFAQTALLGHSQYRYNFPTSRDIMLGHYKEALDFLGVTKPEPIRMSLSPKIQMWEEMIKKMEKEKESAGMGGGGGGGARKVPTVQNLDDLPIGAGGAGMNPIPANAKSINPPTPTVALKNYDKFGNLVNVPTAMDAYDEFEEKYFNLLKPYAIKATEFGAKLAKAAPAADLAYMAVNSMSDQYDAATGGYGNNVYDKEYGKSDPLSLRPVYDALFSDGNFIERINDPEWVQRNPRSAALYNLLMAPAYAASDEVRLGLAERKDLMQYPRAFASAYTPEGLNNYFNETFKEENKAILETPKFNFPVGMTPVR